MVPERTVAVAHDLATLHSENGCTSRPAVVDVPTVKAADAATPLSGGAGFDPCAIVMLLHTW